MDAGTITAMLTGIAGIVVGITGLLTARRTAEQSAKESELNRLSRIMDEIQEQNQSLLKRVRELERDVQIYQRWAAMLARQVVDLGGVPVKLEDTETK